MFSSRIPDDLCKNRLTLVFEAKQRENTAIHDLTLSNPTRSGLSYLGRIPLKALTDPAGLTYEPNPKGLIGARQAIAAYYTERGLSASPEEIVLTSSTSEAYSVLFKLFANPGDAILFPRPSYPLFKHLALLEGVGLKSYSIHYANGWWYDLEQLTSLLRTPVKLLSVVNPNNPTGSYITRDAWKHLQECCARQRIPVVCDEVFFDYPLGGYSPETDLADSRNTEALTFVLNGLSKSSGLPQLKLSWILVLGPEDLKRQALVRLDFILDAYLSVGTPIQRALPEVLSSSLPTRNRIQDRLDANLHHLRLQTAGTAIECLEVEGGWYAVLRLPGARTDEEWALHFLEEGNVLVHPGCFYEFSDRNHVVLSLLPEPKSFSQGLQSILELAGNHHTPTR